MRLSEVGEFGFIDRINRDLVVHSASLALGVGDDAAAIRTEPGKVTVLATDTLVEQVDFLTDRIAPEQLGHKALAVNLSDLAAMGARPEHALVTLAVPIHHTVEYLSGIYDGIRALAKRYGVNVIGGDVSSAPNDLMLSVVVTGSAREDQLVRRDGARPGDVIMLAGVVGESAAGLDIVLERRTLAADFPKTLKTALLERHLRPEPLVAEGTWLANAGVVNAMIDVSDGLAADLGHICRQSAVGAELDEEKLPTTDALREYCAATGADQRQLALAGGEDYALLFTVPRVEAEAFAGRFRERFETPLAEIGAIVDGDRPLLRAREGELEDIAGGFEHFLQKDSDG